MSARDELALILVNNQRARYDLPPRSTTAHCSESCWAEVDAILAAGYRKTRTITSADELDALPVGSAVLSETIAYQKHDDDDWSWSAAGRFWSTHQIGLPAVVIHEPEAQA